MGTHCNMAAALISVRRFDEAAEHCRQAMKAAKGSAGCGKAYFDLGRICDAQHRPAEAVENFDRALKLAKTTPTRTSAWPRPISRPPICWQIRAGWTRRSAITARCWQLSRAWRTSATTWLSPWPPTAGWTRRSRNIKRRWNRPPLRLPAKTWTLRLPSGGNFERQIAGLRRALGADRTRADSHDQPGLAAGGLSRRFAGNANEAIELAERANRLCGGKHFGPLMSLAAAYAEAGRFPEAVATASHALALVNAQAQPAVADEVVPQIGLYQAGKPIRIQPHKGLPTRGPIRLARLLGACSPPDC